MAALSLPGVTTPGDVRLNILSIDGPISKTTSRVSKLFTSDDSVIVKIDMEKINKLFENLSKPTGTPLSEAHISELNLLNEKIFGSSQCCEKAKLINLAAALVLGFTAGIPCFFNDDPTLGFFITGVVGMVSYLFFEHMNRKGQREMMSALVEKNNLCTELTKNSMANAKDILNAYQCDIIALKMLKFDPTYASDLTLLEPVIFEKDSTSDLAISGRTKKFQNAIQALENNFVNLKTSIIAHEIEQGQAEKILEPLAAVVAIINGKEHLGSSASILKEHQATILNERLKFLVNTLKARQASEIRRLSVSARPPMVGGREVRSFSSTPVNLDRKSTDSPSSNSSHSDSPSPPRTPPVVSTHLEQAVPQLPERSLTPPINNTRLLKSLNDRTRTNRYRGPARAFTDIVSHTSIVPHTSTPALSIGTPANIV